jgi:hypothetical protein
MQQRNGRRGYVFSMRITREDRSKLEQLQKALEKRGDVGPRALGPWLVWRALNAPRPGKRGITRVVVAPPSTAVPSRRGNTRAAANRKPLILDLCAGSGAWSEPYLKSGKYRVVRVTLPKHDVRTFKAPDEPVHGILAAPPCDQFSLARNGHKSPRNILRGLEVVNACMRIIAQCRPTWWALENPVGMLSKYLGTPRDTWQPCDFGDPWTKQTAIWGDFNIPERGPFVKPLGGGPFCTLCDPKRRKTRWCNNPAHRAITPAGFARAFFKANP